MVLRELTVRFKRFKNIRHTVHHKLLSPDDENKIQRSAVHYLFIKKKRSNDQISYRRFHKRAPRLNFISQKGTGPSWKDWEPAPYRLGTSRGVTRSGFYPTFPARRVDKRLAAGRGAIPDYDGARVRRAAYYA